METTKKRALVISGGGSKGAWGGGIAHALINKHGAEWDRLYGCSTGSLLVTLTALREMERLKKAYTTVSSDDIFSVNPFTKDGKIRVLNAVWRIIQGKTSLGESGNLSKKVYDFFTLEDFLKIQQQGKEIFCTVTNFTTGEVEYKSSAKLGYTDYVEYTVASTSVPVAMDLVRKDGSEYLDGGVMEHVPLQKAIDDGADVVDVIIMRPENYPRESWKAKNILQVFMRTVDVMEKEVSTSDVLIGKLLARKDVTLNFYYTPRVLTDNSLIFDEKQMSGWWDEAYASVMNDTIAMRTVALRRG